MHTRSLHTRSLLFGAQFFGALAFFLSQALPLSAIKTKSFSSEEAAQNYLDLHFSRGCSAYQKEAWKEASQEFERIVYFFPEAAVTPDVYYLMGTSYFNMGEYDFANWAFSSYLTSSEHPVYFQQTMQYKFCIAEAFRGGHKRRPLTMRYLPKVASGKELALEIYDEIIATLPGNELGVQALLAKGDVLCELWEFRKSVETYQLAIRRFPQHECVPLCYVKIGETYLQQSEVDFQNPDLIGLAELNCKRFESEFPGDERLAIAVCGVSTIKERFAQGLCDIGRFYERKGRPRAAAIYYESAVQEFPETLVAEFCRQRLQCLDVE